MIYKKKGKCPKCGYQYTSDKFCAAGSSEIGNRNVDLIQRKCRNCGYTWDEEPLDTKEQESKAE